MRGDVLSPGAIETPILNKGGLTREQADAFVTRVPLGRIGTPDEVAKAAVFLASGGSSYVTSIELFVDGGAAQV